MNISIDGYCLSLDGKDIGSYLREMVKIKGRELKITSSSYDTPRVIHDFTILNKYLDDIAPSAIVFDSIGFDCNPGKRYVHIVELISKIAKIPSVKFKQCYILLGFYQYLFVENMKTVAITFENCQILPVYKNAIMNGLRWNYTIRDLTILESDSMFDSSKGKLNNNIAVDGTIKQYMFRNRSRYLCRMATITLIGIRNRRNSIFDIIDKSLMIYFAKILYSTKPNVEWLRVIFTDELKNNGNIA